MKRNEVNKKSTQNLPNCKLCMQIEMQMNVILNGCSAVHDVDNDDFSAENDSLLNGKL